MRFMNEYQIQESLERWAWHPVLGPATETLAGLRVAVNQNSDGWAYWPKPTRAAAKLMELIDGDGTSEFHRGDRPDATVAKLKAAYVPIKAFRTRCLKNGMKLDFEIVPARMEVGEEINL